MTYYKTKPRVVDVIEHDPEKNQDLFDFIGNPNIVWANSTTAMVWVEIKQKDINVDSGDFVVKDSKGRFDVYKPTIFHETFDKV